MHCAGASGTYGRIGTTFRTDHQKLKLGTPRLCGRPTHHYSHIYATKLLEGEQHGGFSTVLPSPLVEFIDGYLFCTRSAVYVIE